MPPRFGVAGTGAVNSLIISVAFEGLSAVCALERVYRFALHQFWMGVPPCHAALVGAELLRLFVRQLFERLSTLRATSCFGSGIRMTATEGFNTIHRQSERSCDFLITHAALLERQNRFLFLIRHSHTSFRE